MIKSFSYSQEEIIKNIIELHLGGKNIECDPTYSRGIFYRKIKRPKYTFDLSPQDRSTIQADCRKLPLGDGEVESIMFDPPFIIGGSSKSASYANPVEGSNLIHKRFSSFSSPAEMGQMYKESLKEFYRILKENGILIVKCQDQVSSGKQYMSHVFLINTAEELGFYTKDLFLLLSKGRITSGKWKVQRHARKHHSYFIVFSKEKSKISYGTISTAPESNTGERDSQTSSKGGDAWESVPIWLSDKAQLTGGISSPYNEKDVLEGNSDGTPVVPEG